MYLQIGVPSRDVPLHTAQQKFKLAKTKQDKDKYAKLVQHLIKVTLILECNESCLIYSRLFFCHFCLYLFTVS